MIFSVVAIVGTFRTALQFIEFLLADKVIEI